MAILQELTTAEVEVSDKRRLRGARTRQLVLHKAVNVASLSGLEGVSFGRLATETGLSKAGIQTLFRSKEALQLAAIDFAREMFIAAVTQPARSAEPGLARLRSLIEHWITYAEAPLLSGGCFRAANLAEYDSKPGPIQDAIFRDHADWLAVIARELRHAIEAGEIAELDVDLTAFQLDAVLCATNTALRMGDAAAANKLRRIVDGLLGGA